eukprot:Amastigsp_a346559_4.p2 type:complete len:128 gc:universal Amastigsp_a346559_4:862-479(-)
MTCGPSSSAPARNVAERDAVVTPLAKNSEVVESCSRAPDVCATENMTEENGPLVSVTTTVATAEVLNTTAPVSVRNEATESSGGTRTPTRTPRSFAYSVTLSLAALSSSESAFAASYPDHVNPHSER